MAGPITDRLTKAQLRGYAELLRLAVKNGRGRPWVVREFRRRYDETIGDSTVAEHLSRVKAGEVAAVIVFEGATKAAARAAETIAKAETTEISGNDEGQLVFMRSKTVRTLDGALAAAKVDLAKWDVERYVINKWDSVAKIDRDGGKTLAASELWQVKVWLKAKKGWSTDEFREILIRDLKRQAPSYRPIKRTAKAEPILAELSIFDAHFGKLAWAAETTQNYDLKICRERYMGAGRDLLARASREAPERILYVVGNDFFHTDQGRMGTTTNGTPQDVDGRWQKAFRIGVQCAVTLSEEAAQIAPVDVMIVPGNHDAEKAFCLGEVLAARFHNHPSITVRNTPDVYAYYRWGKVLLGFVHGDNHTNDKKRNLLPLTMATDNPKDWAETVWREMHLGHFHSEREDVWKYRTVEHVKDVAVRVLPSLSSTDAWHRRSDYKSVLAAECHLYHRDRGRWGYLVHCAEG